MERGRWTALPRKVLKMAQRLGGGGRSDPAEAADTAAASKGYATGDAAGFVGEPWLFGWLIQGLSEVPFRPLVVTLSSHEPYKWASLDQI